ncbi:hypothetical protein I546_1948 [Mycobacterium kansasii 732]|nr:hypothetical protein I546_1948 [Mycobacterium kansasii 732]
MQGFLRLFGTFRGRSGDFHRCSILLDDMDRLFGDGTGDDAVAA